MSRVYLLSLLLILVSVNSDPAPHKYDAWDYVFDGSCMKNEPICLPFSNISFSYLWERKTKKEIIDDANEYLKNSALFKKKMYIDDSRTWYGKKLGLFAQEKIASNDTLASYKFEDLYLSIFSIDQFKHTNYYEEHKKLLKFKFGNHTGTIQLALNLLYHFYHFEDSPLKTDLLLFPEKPNTPLFLLSKYELHLLRQDEAYEHTHGIRKSFLEKYDEMNNILNQTGWTSAQFQTFWNRSSISLDDWTYVNFLMYTFSVVHESPDGKNIFFIPPFTKLIVKKKEDNEEVTNKAVWSFKGNESNTEDYNFINTAAIRFSKKDEIVMGVEMETYHAWINLGYLDENAEGCINTLVVPENFAKSSNLPNYHCISRKDETLLAKIYLSGNMINMEEKQAKKCAGKVSSAGKISDEKKMEIIFNECKHPKWKKVNIFKAITTEIDTRKNSFLFAIPQADNVGARRLKDSASYHLAVELREYLKYKNRLCDWILDQIKYLKKINKKMNKFSDKDIKQMKKILEEKLNKEEEDEIEREMREDL